MFGFSAYSEAPISQGDPSIDASTFVADTLAQTYAADIAYDAKAFFTLNNIDATLRIEELDTGLSAFLNINPVNSVTDVTDLDTTAEANQTLSSFLNSSVVNTLSYTATANTSIEAVGNGITANTIDFAADANITTGNTFATLYSNALADVTGEAAFSVPTSNLNLEKTKPTYTLDNFDYEALRDYYDRTRTIYLIRYNTNKTTHVSSQNYTVYILPENESTVVHVNHENYTVVLPKPDGSNTVYIAA